MCRFCFCHVGSLSISEPVFDLKNLLTTIHTCFKVNVMWTMQFASYLVFDIGITLKRVMGPAHVPLGFANFTLWNSHYLYFLHAALWAIPRSASIFTCTSPFIRLNKWKSDKIGGARRDRTDDLMLAKHALSQLSYGPFTL